MVGIHPSAISLLALSLFVPIDGALASTNLQPVDSEAKILGQRHDTSVFAHQFIDVARRLQSMDGWNRCEFPPDMVGAPGPQSLSWPTERGGGVLSLTVATGHVKPVNALSTSADGRYLISASEDNTAIIWDARRLQQLVTLKGRFDAVALSPDGSQALTGGRDGFLRLWDTDSAAEIDQYKIDGGQITAVGFSSVGSRFLAGSSRSVRVWDRTTGETLPKLEWPTWASTTAIAHDGSRAAVVTNGNLIWWDAKNGRQLHRVKIEGKVVSLAIAADGRAIAAFVEFRGRKSTVAYWDVQSDRLVPRSSTEVRLASATPEPRSLAFSRIGSSPDMFVGSTTGGVYLLSGSDGQVIVSREPLNNGVLDASFVEDDGGLLTAHSDGAVHYWSTGRGAAVRRFESDGRGVRLASLTSDGRRLLAASHDALSQWDLMSGGPAREFRWDEELLSREFAKLAPREIVAGDDRHILINNADVLELWDARQDRLLKVFHPADGVSDATVMALGARATPSLLVTASRAGQLNFFDVGSGSLRQSASVTDGSVTTLAVSPDEQRVLVGDANGRVWSFDSDGTLVDEVSAAHQGSVLALAWSVQGDRYATGGADGVVRLWDAASGDGIATFDDHRPNAVRALAFSAKAGGLASGGEDGSVYLHDLTASRSPAHEISKRQGPVTGIALSPRARAVGVRIASPHSVTWDLEHLKFKNRWGDRCSETQTIFWLPSKPVPHATEVPVPDSAGTTALVTTDHGVVQIDLETGRPLSLYRVSRFGGRPATMVLSGDREQRYVLVAGRHLHLFDRRSGRLLEDYRGKGRVEQLIISPDLRYLLGRTDTSVALWNRAKRRKTLFTHEDSKVTPQLFSMAYLAATHTVATGGEDGTARFWNAADGAETKRLEGHVGEVGAIAFSSDGAMAVTGSREGMLRLWDVGDATLQASAIAFPDHEWGVSGPLGRYDAANGGDIERMYWVYRKEVIGLSQLKSRYFEPGLLGKILGVNDEPLRPVSQFNAPELFPEVKLELVGDTDAPDLRITLRERGGGVGAISVAVNGRQVIEDARQQSMESDNGLSVITVDLSEFQRLLLNEKMVRVSGQENVVAVRAANEEGYLVSRPHELAYPAPVVDARGVARAEDEEDKEAVTQRFWAVVAGISDYAGEEIDLRYAAKDAQNIAKSLHLAATQLFGVDNVHISLLTSSMSEDIDEKWHHGPATKEGFQSVFEELSLSSRAQDVLVVYLAGHGVSIDDQYHYLMSDATGVPAATDSEALASNTVSSAEIEGWLRRSAALKQVVILDTCAAGSAATEFTNARFVSTAQARELERMKDRTGFHVLMGSAADAVSYEATRYEQGLLTYSLLQGMKGVALRDDEFVDVSHLFQYAADEVPRLASVIGGIQAPIVAAPRGTSFSIGQLDLESRQQIPLSQAKPLLLPPRLTPDDDAWFNDAMSLENGLCAGLRDASQGSARGERSAVYVDARQVPGAIFPRGRYTDKGDTAEVTFVLWRDGKKLTNGEFIYEGNKVGMSDAIVTKIFETIEMLELGD